jgi:acyl carrier protein
MTASLDVVRNAVARVCGTDAAGLDASTSLADLGADSLALVSIADVVEAELAAAGGALQIDDASLGRMSTVGEIVGYVDAHRGELARA